MKPGYETGVRFTLSHAYPPHQTAQYTGKNANAARTVRSDILGCPETKSNATAVKKPSTKPSKIPLTTAAFRGHFDSFESAYSPKKAPTGTIHQLRRMIP